MILTLTLIALITAALAWALLRETARVEQERLFREWLRTSPDYALVRQAFEDLAEMVRKQVSPAFSKASAELAWWARSMQGRDQ